MPEYPEFLHGTRGLVKTDGANMTNRGKTRQAIVYLGTAPVHQVEGGAKNVNKPILVKNMAEARAMLGYSDDWASYTLCEAMRAHFEMNAVGPLVFINVFDPARHRKLSDATENKTPADGAITLSNADQIQIDTIQVGTKTKDTDYTVSVDETTNTVILEEKTSGALGTSSLTVTYKKAAITSASLTPVNGRVTIASAEDVIQDTITIMAGAAEKVRGTDWTAAYDFTRKAIIITEKTTGALGSDALTITYEKADPSAATSADVIGATDTYGLNTGAYAIKSVYNVTGYIPAFLLAPGFSSIPAIHNALWLNSQQIGKHWNAWMFVDMPITDNGTPITLASAPAWKAANGYNHENESVFFPLAKGTDGKIYHLSVLNAANFQALMIQNSGIPYMSGSNTECGIIEDLYFSELVQGRVYDDEIINRCLNANGINSAAYVGGRWVIWGMFAASYNQDDGDAVNINDTSLMMLYYLTNDFQHRRNIDIDKPMAVNALKTIVAEEQTRVDALLGIGALTYGKVQLDATKEARADVYKGDFRVTFHVTTTPLAKSLTAIANWTDQGFEVYFAAMDEAM